MTEPLAIIETLHLHRERPVADQIAAQLAERIEAGLLAPGTRLPSIRELARSHGVNRNTVAQAYRELAEKGYLETRFGGGSTVRLPAAHPAPAEPNGGTAVPEALSEAEWERRFARRWAGGLSLTNGRPLFRRQAGQPVNLFQNRPTTALFPLQRFRQCLNTVLRRGGAHLLNYGSPAGYLPLREQIARRLQQRDVPADPSQVLITSGSQQGIDLVGRAFVDPGDGVVVESPMYSVAMKIFAAHGAELVPYGITPEGLRLSDLEGLAGRQPPKLFYAVPNYQNPTTYCYAAADKQALLHQVYGAGSLLVEDDSDFELRHPAGLSPALAALDGLNRVLYLNTFSKTLVPAVRVGYVAGPAPVMRRLTELKEMTDLSNSLILQAAVAEFMERGYFDEHVAAVRDYYRQRMAKVLTWLEAALPAETPFTRPEGGLCVWVDLPPYVDTVLLYQHLRQQGVLISPGSLYQPRHGGRNGLRLCVASETEERVAQAIRLLGDALREVLRQPPPTAQEQEYQAIH